MPNAHFSSPHEVEKRRHNEALEIGDHGYCAEIPKDFRDMALILFPEGSLKNSNGTVVPQDHLKGKSVALYFGDGEDSKCTSFLPFLLQFYKTVNEAGSHQKIEVIYVSLDKNQASFKKHRSHMPWLSVDIEDPLTDVLKQHYRVMKEYEVPTYGYGPRTGIPALVIVQEDGREAQFLHVSAGREEGERGLLRWDWRNTIFS